MVNSYYEKVSKVIWQKAASPICDSSQLRMDLDPHLIHGSLGPPESAPRRTSRSVQPRPICTGHVCVTNTQTDRPRYVRHACLRCGLKRKIASIFFTYVPDMYSTGLLSLLYPPWDGKMSTSQRTVMFCGWGVKAGMV